MSSRRSGSIRGSRSTCSPGEEQFPDIVNPIQMRWDSRGRLWVSCSTTYPHVYPGNEPNDKLVILEDTDGDGKADKSTVFADDLHIPLSFEFGDGGVYVSDMPHLTFLKDTDGDGKADFRQQLLAGFGTEDSHHALHDFTWTPDGDLIFRESIFHHSQVETPYGPVRQQNSGWFRFTPRTHRLISFGTYSSTNPWGVTFDDWGQHVASHPVYAAAFHSLDPPYPQQHPTPKGLHGVLRRLRARVRRLRHLPRRAAGGLHQGALQADEPRRDPQVARGAVRLRRGVRRRPALLDEPQLHPGRPPVRSARRSVCLRLVQPREGAHAVFAPRRAPRPALGPHLADHHQGQAAPGSAEDRRMPRSPSCSSCSNAPSTAIATGPSASSASASPAR